MIIQVKSSYFPGKTYNLAEEPELYICLSQDGRVFILSEDDGSGVARLRLESGSLWLRPLASEQTIFRGDKQIHDAIVVSNEDTFLVKECLLRFEFHDNEIVLMIGVVPTYNENRKKTVKLVTVKPRSEQQTQPALRIQVRPASEPEKTVPAPDSDAEPDESDPKTQAFPEPELELVPDSRLVEPVSPQESHRKTILRCAMILIVGAVAGTVWILMTKSVPPVTKPSVEESIKPSPLVTIPSIPEKKPAPLPSSIQEEPPSPQNDSNIPIADGSTKDVSSLPSNATKRIPDAPPLSAIGKNDGQAILPTKVDEPTRNIVPKIEVDNTQTTTVNKPDGTIRDAADKAHADSKGQETAANTQDGTIRDAADKADANSKGQMVVSQVDDIATKAETGSKGQATTEDKQDETIRDAADKAVTDNEGQTTMANKAEDPVIPTVNQHKIKEEVAETLTVAIVPNVSAEKIVPAVSVEENARKDDKPSPLPDLSSVNAAKAKFAKAKTEFENNFKLAGNQLSTELWKTFYEAEPMENEKWTDEDYGQAVRTYQKLQEDISLGLKTSACQKDQERIFGEIDALSLPQKLEDFKQVLLDAARNARSSYDFDLPTTLDKMITETMAKVKEEMTKTSDLRKSLADRQGNEPVKYEAIMLRELDGVLDNWRKRQDNFLSIQEDFNVARAFGIFLPKGVAIREQGEKLTQLYNRLAAEENVPAQQLQEAYQKIKSLCLEAQAIEKLPDGIVVLLAKRLEEETKSHRNAMEVLNERQ